MSSIHIRRNHHLGLAGARKVAWKWAEHVEAEFDMECSYAEGKDGDEVNFTRTGVKGTLLVTADHFELDAKLGLLLGVFKDRIESEIVKNLDELLTQKKAPAARKKKA
ncbi:MAG: polyhydroxyalkanoic acid system family protein [Hydrogenophaga sp.]|nr:polyhydroxyalkanoic acid system family protein [Hydrogenophaga sp.]